MAFGPYRLYIERRMLAEGDKPVRLGSRGLAILNILLERPGELVTHAELFERVWDGAVIDESALRVHIAALRKTLGDGQSGARYIVNEVGRGYRFVAPVTVLDRGYGPPVATPIGPAVLPAPLKRMLGRGALTETLAERLESERLLTLVGPGGMGKTTLALALAERQTEVRRDGARFVDLAGITDPVHVPAAIARVVGVSVGSADVVTSLVSHLLDRDVLIVLDNCEHVIEAAAATAEALISKTRDLRILATSREPLRAEGERVHRVSGLETAPTGLTISAFEALSYPAIELFVERAKALVDDFELHDAEAQAVARICHQLDGVPLAIELAASRIDQLGLRGLLSELDEQFITLNQGRRTALPRHQTVGALIDWSYDLLDEAERLVFRRLSVFRGAFTLDAARAVCADDAIDETAVLACLYALSAKSLAVHDASGETVLYRLPHLTRVYAQLKLRGSNEDGEIRRRHARYLLAFLDRADEAWTVERKLEWLETFGGTIDDVRAALDWAFATPGEAGLATALTAAALPIGLQLTLLEEFRAYVERALKLLVEEAPDYRLEMRLTVAMGNLNGQMRGTTPETAAAFARTLELSDQLGMTSYQIEALMGMWVWAFGLGDYPASATFAERLGLAASGASNPDASLLAQRKMSQSRHFMGDHGRARQLAERVLTYPSRTLRLGYNTPFQIDRRASMRIVLARMDWLEGKIDRAVSIVDEAIAIAEDDTPFTLCQVLALAAIPIAFWRGEDDRVAPLVKRLIEHAWRYSSPHWAHWGENFDRILAARRMRDSGVRPLVSDIVVQGAKQLDMHATLMEQLAVPMAAARAESPNPGWSGPEVLRAIGENRLRQGGPEARAEAEARFARAAMLAERQGALSWSLRIAMSQARMKLEAGLREEAEHLLAPVLERFTEGRGTRDLRAAVRLLGEIQS
ncbi:MAG: helix-turn-helix transcriptional regulator [Caulobacter sp.]|nr:helix-turn-helix transcriptional regulator [Caulobacter sp.]